MQQTVWELLSIKLAGEVVTMEYFNPLASLTVIFMFVFTIFSYVVLRPLNTAISELRITIKELRNDIYANEERRHALEIKVAEINQSARSAHHRIDTLQEKILK